MPARASAAASRAAGRDTAFLIPVTSSARSQGEHDGVFVVRARSEAVQHAAARPMSGWRQRTLRAAVRVGVALCLALVIAGDQADADALTNRQRRLAIDWLRTTDAGLSIRDALARHGYDPHREVSFADLAPHRDGRLFDFDPRSHRIRVHHELLSAPPRYLSWMLAQALVEAHAHLLTRRHGYPALPRLIEIEQWALVLAMRHWMQLGAPAEDDFALDRSPVHRDIVTQLERLEASPTRWVERLREGDFDVFLAAAARRVKRLHPHAITIDEQLARSDLSRRQRAATEALRAAWQAARAEECARWPRCR